MACSPGPTSATPAPLGVAGHALVLGAQPPKRRRHHYGLGSLVDPHSLGHSRSIHNPGIPVEPPARPVAEAHRVVFAPQEETRPVAARVEVRGPGGAAMSMTGAWRIVGMDLWDAEAIDLLGPGYIQFGADRTGRFRFIAVEGWMDCHSGRRDGRPCVEFTWEGNDESDPASGRGWAALEEDGSLRGHIYFHLGDDSGFRAVRAEDAPKPEAESYPRG